MKRSTRRSILIVLSALFLSACGGGGGGGATTPPAPPTLTSIAVTPLNPTTALNAKLQLTAIGTYSDNTTQNITSSVIWSSGNTALATVGTNTGLITPTAGATTNTVVITAASGVQSGTATVTLTALPTFSLTSCTSATVAGCEPLAFQQWGLLNTAQTGFADTAGVASTGANGTDINANNVYSTNGYTGYGVTVAVVDSGLEIAHEDLAANVVAGGSWNFVNSTTDPTSTATTGDHGTSVGGLIAMAKNGKGGMGVAPNAQLKGFNYISSSQLLAYKVASLGGSPASPNSTDVAVFNQSSGTSNSTVTLMNTTVEAQYASGTSTLRGGKGALYVKSAGNGFRAFGTAVCTQSTAIGVSCQNANFDPSDTLPYNIVVAALNAKGIKSSYSTAGSAVWTSAPGGEYGLNTSLAGGGFTAVSYDPAMVTADQSGCTNGYSSSAVATSLFDQGGTNLASINLSCNYTSTFNGTSSAAPMLSGVIALILEANPSLTWRDVKHILALTAVKVDAAVAPVTLVLADGSYVTEQGWILNAAARNFHNWYGFGAVDASAAVAMAKGVCAAGCGLGTFANTGWITSNVLNLAIADNSIVGQSAALTVPAVGTGGIVEAVQIKVTTANGTSGFNGDLGIELISPSGTKSILKNVKDGMSGTNLPGMVFESNAFYGETSAGSWTIKVVDGWAAGTQTLTNVQIRVYGH